MKHYAYHSHILSTAAAFSENTVIGNKIIGGETIHVDDARFMVRRLKPNFKGLSNIKLIWPEYCNDLFSVYRVIGKVKHFS